MSNTNPNVAPEFDFICTVAKDSPHVGHAHYKLVDGPGNESNILFSAVTRVVEELSKGKRVLVNCVSGRSRSVTVCACALAQLRGVSPEVILEEIKSVHAEAAPHPAIWELARKEMPFLKWSHDKSKARPIEEVISVLNGAFRRDSVAMHALLCVVIPCNNELSFHPSVQVQKSPVGDDAYFLTVVGLLNGVIEPLTGSKIAACWDKSSTPPRLVGFREYKP